MSLVVFVVMVISRGPGVIGSFILIRVKILVVGARVMARSSTWISFVVNITLFKVSVLQNVVSFSISIWVPLLSISVIVSLPCMLESLICVVDLLFFMPGVVSLSRVLVFRYVIPIPLASFCIANFHYMT